MPDPALGTLFTTHGRITTGLVALLGAVQVYRWVARRKFGVGYGLVWLATCLGILLVAAVPSLLLGLGRLAGSREPEGALRLAGFLFIAAILLYLSLKASALEDKLERLVQATALREALAESARRPPLPEGGTGAADGAKPRS
jgi:hypothetical protein